MEHLDAWIKQERERLSDEAYFAGGALVPDAAMLADFNELEELLAEVKATRKARAEHVAQVEKEARAVAARQVRYLA